MSIRVAVASSDAAAIARIYAPAVTASHISFELTPPPSEEMARRVTTTLTRYPWLVDESEGKAMM